MNNEKAPHIPIMVEEILSFFRELKVKAFFEGTLGAGGHAQKILEAHPEIEKYIACDGDPQAIEIASSRLDQWKNKLHIFHGNFADLEEYLKKTGANGVDGFLFDLGVSSMQLDRAEKGFSFSKDGPLDMRMNPDLPLTAEDIVNDYDEESLGEILREFGEEPRWRLAAKLIVERRAKERIRSTKQLADILFSALRSRDKKIHPATLVFQGLRIAVNRELEVLEQGLQAAIKHLNPGGRIGVISFHSLEDRIVKNLFRDLSVRAKDGMKLTPVLTMLTKKPMVASNEEVKYNPRARSAKLRFAEKL